MTATETEKAEIAALSAKLALARNDTRDKDKELNALRTEVAKLKDKSNVERLAADNEALRADLAAATGRGVSLQAQLEKAQRDLRAAGAATDLVAAIKTALG